METILLQPACVPRVGIGMAQQPVAELLAGFGIHRDIAL